jgi:hypothetical protein
MKISHVWQVRSMFLACLCLAGPAVAQEPEPRFELTPFTAWRGGGEFSDTQSSASIELRESNAFGVTFNGAVKQNTQWEVFYGRQSTEADPMGTLPGTTVFDMDIDTLHVGGTYLFDGDKVIPFIAMTLGASRYDPHPAGYSAKTFISGSFGGGWKFNLARNFGIRAEARAYGSLIDSDNRLFCESDGGAGTCLIILEGEVLAQWEARVGLTLRFD